MIFVLYFYVADKNEEDTMYKSHEIIIYGNYKPVTYNVMIFTDKFQLNVCMLQLSLL